MNNFQVLQLSASYVRKSRFAWLYIFVSCAAFFVPSSTVVGKNLILLCIFTSISLSLVVVSLIFFIGFVHYISQKHLNHTDISISESWDRGKSLLGRVLGVCFLVGTPLIFLFLIYWFIFPTALATLLATIIFSTVLIPVIHFSLCAIVIDQVKVMKSISTGFQIMSNHLSSSLALGGFFFLLQNILLGLLILIIFSVVPSEIPFPMNFDFSTYHNLLQVPIISLSNQVAGVMTGSWSVAAFTILYLNFTRESPSNEMRK